MDGWMNEWEWGENCYEGGIFFFFPRWFCEGMDGWMVIFSRCCLAC